MPKAKHRKETEFQTEMTRSVFLIGNPNLEKLKSLMAIQKTFTEATNYYIQLLESRRNEYLVQLIKNDQRESAMRELEKTHRFPGLGSAFAQAAFDNAVTMLSNRYDDIRMELYKQKQDILTQSKVAFASVIIGKSKQEIVDTFLSITDGYKLEAKKAFYLDAAKKVSELSDDVFSLRAMEIQDGFAMLSHIFRVPYVKKAWVDVDSRTYTLEASMDIKAPFVASITVPWEKGIRLEIPVDASQDAIRRMKQYGYAKSATFTITPKGQLRLAVAFKKKLRETETKEYVGVDTGIKDCFYLSDGTHYGTMDKVIQFYKDVAEPSEAGISDLRNKKRKILHYVKKHPNLPIEVRRSLLKKVDNLETMIRKAKEPDHKRRAYYHLLQHVVAASTRDVLSSLQKDQCVVLEKLDIKEFNKGRKANGMLSVFSRGLLQKKLMEELNWHGFSFVEVEPDYTSQLCPECSHVEKANRNGKEFHCKCCGYEADADFTASKNIRVRATDPEVLEICAKNRYQHKKMQADLMDLYTKRNEEWRKNHKTEGDTSTAA